MHARKIQKRSYKGIVKGCNEKITKAHRKMKKLLVFGKNEKTRGMYLNAKSEDTIKSLKVIG